MIDAFRIGVSIGFKTSGLSQLTGMARHLTTLNRLSREVNLTLEKMQQTARKAFSLRGVQEGASGLRTVASAAQKVSTEVNRARLNSAELVAELRRVRAEAAEAGAVPPLALGVPRGPGRGGGGAGGGGAGGGGAASEGGGAALAAGGVVAMWAGRDGLRSIWDIVRGAEELNRELNRTKMLGGDFAATLDQQRALAFQITRTVPTSLPAENARLMRELGTQMGGPQEAMKIAPLAAQFGWVLEQFTGKPSDDGMKNAIRAIVDRGAVFSTGVDGKEHIDPTKFQSEMNAVYRAIVLSGGLLTPQNLLQMVRQAGPSARLMDQNTFYTQMTEAAIAMGASRAGTASMSMFQQLAGGTMTRRTVEEMQRVGLISADEWRAAKGGGGHIVVTPEATRRLAALASDPLKMVEETLMPKFKQMGMSSQDMLVEVFRLFGQRTTQRLVADLMNNQPQFARLRGMFGDVSTIPQAYKELQGADLSTNIRDLSAAWGGLMAALGTAATPQAISLLKDLTAGVKELTTLSLQHPRLAAFMLDIAGIGSAVLVIGGAAAVARVALGGFAGVLGLFGPGGAAAVGLETLTGAAGLPALGVALGGLAGPLAAVIILLGGLAAALMLIKGKDDPNYNRTTPYGPNEPHAARPGVPVLPFMQPRVSPRPPSSPFPGGTSLAPPVQKQSYLATPDGAPLHVIVVNAADIGRGAASGTLARIGQAAFRPPTGPTAGDLRTTASYPARMAQS